VIVKGASTACRQTHSSISLGASVRCNAGNALTETAWRTSVNPSSDHLGKRIYVGNVLCELADRSQHNPWVQ
jgi:hypothetical protein